MNADHPQPPPEHLISIVHGYSSANRGLIPSFDVSLVWLAGYATDATCTVLQHGFVNTDQHTSFCRL